MKVFKKATLLLTLVLTLSLVIPFMVPFQNNVTTTNAASDKSKITSTVNNYFKAAKKLDLKKMSKYATVDENYDLNEFAPLKDLFKYMKDRNKSMTCTIKKVKVSQNEAKVTVKCKYIDATNTYKQNLWNVVVYALDNGIEDYTAEEFLALYNQTLKDYLKGNAKAYKKTFKTKTFELNMIKVNGKWMIDSNNEDLANVLTSNFIKTFNDLETSEE
jgi:hypothetical protein